MRTWALRVWWLALTGCLAGGGTPTSRSLNLQEALPNERSETDLPVPARRAPTLALDAPPMVAIPRTHPSIGSPTGKGSLSIGTPTTGFVVNCRELPHEGPHHHVLPEHCQRGTGCATDDLVQALERAAEAVSRTLPGSRLAVGNLGRVGGGDIPWSVSHNSGRDADLGFYLVDGAGRPFQARSLIPLDSQGNGEEDGTPVRFDTARNWALVKALLQDPGIQVQWVFLSRPLKKRLLAHAKARREPPGLIARAEETLAQPRRSRPHNDHMHLRISCPPDDVLEGCRDTGTQRSWFVDPAFRIEARVRQLRRLARARAPGVRADAVIVLGRIGTPEAFSAVLEALGDPEVEVRRAAARALWEGGFPGGEQAVVARLAREADGKTSWWMIRAIERHLSPWRRAAVLPTLLAVDRAWTWDLGVFRLQTSARFEALRMASRLPFALLPPAVRQEIEAAGIPKDQLGALWNGETEGPLRETPPRPQANRPGPPEPMGLLPLVLRWVRNGLPESVASALAAAPIVQPLQDPGTGPSEDRDSN